MSEELAKGCGYLIGLAIGLAINVGIIAGVCYLVVKYCL